MQKETAVIKYSKKWKHSEGVINKVKINKRVILKKNTKRKERKRNDISFFYYFYYSESFPFV